MALTSRAKTIVAASSAALLLILVGCASPGSMRAGAESTTESIPPKAAAECSAAAASALPADRVSASRRSPTAGTSDPLVSGAAAAAPAQSSEGDPVQLLTARGCGDRMNQVIDPGGSLVMTGTFPPKVRRDAAGTFAGTVTVTAGGGPRITGVTAPEADVYLTRSGVVVATPLPKDAIGELVAIGPADSAVLSAYGTTRPCAAGVDGLPAGGYEVYAVVVVTRDDGTPVVITGGPWPIQVG